MYFRDQCLIQEVAISMKESKPYLSQQEIEKLLDDKESKYLNQKTFINKSKLKDHYFILT